MDLRKTSKVTKKTLKFLGVIVLSLSVVLFSSVPFSGSGNHSLSVKNAMAGKCCRVVSISNYEKLIGMVVEKVTSVIVDTIVNEFTKLTNYLESASKLPGVLYDWGISETQKMLENIHSETYDRLVSQIQANANPQEWINVVTNNPSAIVPPVVAPNGDSYGSFADFGTFVQGDLSIVYKSFNTLNFENVDPILVKNLKIRIRELESAKVALSQEVAEVGATAEKLKTLNEKLNEQLRKIDEAQALDSYKEEQASKDLLKVQMMQTHVLAELLRNQLNQESILIAQYNQKLAEERSKILTDLIVLHTKVSGQWTVPKR